MDAWQAALLLGACAASLIALRSPRALAWIWLVMASFFLSGAYWDSGLPYPVVFGVACDVAVFFAVLHWGRYRWEEYLVRVVQGMVIINVVWAVLTASDADPSHYVFAAVLEAMNWIALIVIGGGAVAQAAEAGGWNGWGLDRSRHRAGGLRRVVLGLRNPRSARPWTER